MATVYLAHDVRHDRLVALKVLHPELAHALGPERFQREIKLAARLQHPHILTVLDSGETAGHLWFTMPFIEGESLRDRLNREKQLPLDDALRIARESAEALDYAHRHGVLHRDIKPENLLLSESHALVADFGIARALTPDGQENLTETGTSIGTAAYMSPEQAAGERDLDARSDVYSLATVLYEMLAGQTPFTAPTPQAMIARRFTESPRPLAELRDAVPAAISQAVQKALARTPADRYASAADFARALAPAATTVTTAPAAGTAPAVASPPPRRRLPVGLVMLVLGFAIGLGLLFAWRKDHGAETADARTLAVLPFENLGSPDQDYFADGVADQVRGQLSGLAGMQVIARSSSTPYRKTAKPPRQIAQELGVRYLLTGTVRWERRADGTSQVQVNPELVEITDGRPTTRWQQSFDASLNDVFAVQASIAGQVAQALNLALADSTRRELAERPTENLAAYDALLRGDGVSNGLIVSDPPSLRRAAAFYEQATNLDPSFALAWARLAVEQALLYYNSVPSPAMAAAARSSVGRAVALAPDRAETHYARAYLLADVEHDVAGAVHELQTALQRAPANPLILSGLAAFEIKSGVWDSALVHARRAADLDPRAANASGRLGIILRLSRRFSEAMVAFDHALALAPSSHFIREQRAIVSLQEGDLEGARAVLRAAPPEVESAGLISYVASAFDLIWVLDSAQQRALLELSPAYFDDNRAQWAIVRAQTAWLHGDQAAARAWGDSAGAALESQLRDAPGDGQLHVERGLALAFAGSKADAIREAERGITLVGSDSTLANYLRHQLIRVYLLTGEPGKALDRLEPLVKAHYDLTPGWLRIDPNFAALKGNPRFEKLAAGT